MVLEDLDKLRNNAKKGRMFNKKLGLWFYRRIQFCIDYEAKERGLLVVRVNPKGTSSKCHRCGDKLVENSYRTLKCSKCNFIGDRDVVATINIYLKFTSHPRCGEPRVSLNTPKPCENPSGMQGNRDEAMKHINPYKPT